ncbi:NTP transferase domain-containing protein [Stetteria hydrogenophila]
MRVDCIVMAGGRASRLGGAVKPLIEVCGEPMVFRVLRAAGVVCRRIILAYSPHTRDLAPLCSSTAFPGVECLEGSGEGYVSDLRDALALAGTPVLVLPADMPHLTWEVLEDFLVKAMAAPGDVVNLVTSRGPTGVALFKRRGGAWWDVEYPPSPALIDVDTPRDLEEAEEACP